MNFLYDRNNNVLGCLIEHTDYIFLNDKYQNNIGKYIKGMDITEDRNGRYIGKGNLLTTLL